MKRTPLIMTHNISGGMFEYDFSTSISVDSALGCMVIPLDEGTHVFFVSNFKEPDPIQAYFLFPSNTEIIFKQSLDANSVYYCNLKSNANPIRN